MRDERKLLGLTNIGATIARRLEAAGIKTVKDLKTVGPAGAYRRVQALQPSTALPVCYYLYSLQGALDGLHWDALPAKVKDRLLDEAGVRPRTRRASRAGQRA